MRRNHDLRRNSDVSMAAMLMHEMYRSMEPSRRHAALRRISDVVGPDVVRDYLVAYEDTMQEVNQRMPEPQMPQREFSQQSHKHSPGVQHNEATDNGRVNADGCDVEGRSNPRSTGFQHEHANTGTHDDEASAHNNSGATGFEPPNAPREARARNGQPVFKEFLDDGHKPVPSMRSPHWAP